MICWKCGKKLQDDSKFCIYCGAQLTKKAPEAADKEKQEIETHSEVTGDQRAEQQKIVSAMEEIREDTSPDMEPEIKADSRISEEKTGAPSENDCGKAETNSVSAQVSTSVKKNATPKKSRKKVAMLTMTIIAILAAGAVAIVLFFSPTSSLNRAIKERDFDKALNIYQEKFNQKALPEKTVSLLKEALVQIQGDYTEDTITYKEAYDQLGLIGQFQDENMQDEMRLTWKVVDSKRQMEERLRAAEEALEQGEYSSAIEIYQTILETDTSQAEAEAGLQKAKDTMKEKILIEAKEYQRQEDFEKAAQALRSALDTYLKNDQDLTAELNGLEREKAKHAINEAYTATESGEWDEALELLEKYQQENGTNTEIEKAYEDIEKKRPITLINLTMVSSQKVEIHDEVVKDRWDNIYDGTVCYYARYDAYGYYSLNKQFTLFSGTIFPSVSSSNNSDVSVSIYLDGGLVYYQDGITVDTAPIPFKIDTTGASTMRIVTGHNVSTRSELEFGNTHFEKIEENT